MASLFTKPNPFAPSNPPSNPFGSSQSAISQPAQTSSLFGGQSQTQSNPLFGSSQPQQTSLFGGSQPQQSQHRPSLFGATLQPPQSSNIFGPPTQTQKPPSATPFAQQPQHSVFGSTMQQTQQQQNPFGVSQAQVQNQPPKLTSSVWQPGSGLNACKFCDTPCGTSRLTIK
jgi:hypothetical protein